MGLSVDPAAVSAVATGVRAAVAGGDGGGASIDVNASDDNSGIRYDAAAGGGAAGEPATESGRAAAIRVGS